MFYWQCPRTLRTTLVHGILLATYGINISCILRFAKNCIRENKDTTFDHKIAQFDTREKFRLYGTSYIETYFFDLNIKVIGNNIHTGVYDKRDYFGFPIVNFPWLSGEFPRLASLTFHS